MGSESWIECHLNSRSPSMVFPLFAVRMLPDSGIAPARDESTMPGDHFTDGKVVEILFLEFGEN